MGSDNGQRNKSRMGGQSMVLRILRDVCMVCIGVFIGINWGANTNHWSWSSNNSSGILPSDWLSSSHNDIVLSENTTMTTMNTGNSLGLPVLTTDGWHPIHVYYGDTHHVTDAIPPEYRLVHVDKNRNGNKWFAQHGQDWEVFKFLKGKKNGYFVDLAANDAVWASNTYALEQNYGWTGICIEPNPFYWFRLAFRKCHAVGAMVGNVTKLEVGAKFSNGPYGGIVSKEFDNSKLHQAEIQRYTASLEDVLGLFHAPREIDYMSLDVEGAEEFIMSTFPFDTYLFRTMSIERPKPGLRTLLEKNGYVFIRDFRRGDTLWAHKSMVENSTQS